MYDDTTSKNIALALKNIAQNDPEKLAIIAHDIQLTYGKLWKIIEVFALRMKSIGVTNRSFVAVETSDVIVSLATMFATAILGAKFANVDVWLLRSKTLKPTHFLKSPDRVGEPNIPFFEIGHTWSPKYLLPTEDMSFLEHPFASHDEPWWITHSSGTTGSPKFISLSQNLVYDRSMAVKEEFNPPNSVVCSLFGANVRPFFVRATAALLSSGAIVDSVDVKFLKEKGVNLVFGGPAQAIAWLSKYPTSKTFGALQVSGSKIRSEDARTLLKNFAVVDDVYGSSETNKSYVNRYTMDGDSLHVEGVETGSIVELVKKENGSNEVRIKNDVMVEGYIDNEIATENSFRHGWFYPGDLARWGDNGELVILGRDDGIVNLEGRKVSLFAMEQLLSSVDGVSNAAVVRDPREGKPNSLIALIAVERPAEKQQIMNNVQLVYIKNIGPKNRPQYTIAVSQIPLTPEEKVDRAACAKLALGVLGQN